MGFGSSFPSPSGKRQETCQGRQSQAGTDTQHDRCLLNTQHCDRTQRETPVVPERPGAPECAGRRILVVICQINQAPDTPAVATDTDRKPGTISVRAGECVTHCQHEKHGKQESLHLSDPNVVPEHFLEGRPRPFRNMLQASCSTISASFSVGELVFLRIA